MAKHDGVKVAIGGTELVIAPLNLRTLRRLSAEGHLANLDKYKGGIPDTAQLDALAAIVAAAIQRNHPQVDVDWVLDNVELGDIGHLYALILSASGFKEKAPGEAVGP